MELNFFFFFFFLKGVFVSPSELEDLFGSCPRVANCFIFSSDDGESIVAAVVPRARETTEREVLQEMRLAAQKANLAGYLVPKRVLIDIEPWTEANGLLSAVGKVSRPALQKRFHCNVQNIPLPPPSIDQGFSAGLQALLFDLLGGTAVFDGESEKNLFI